MKFRSKTALAAAGAMLALVALAGASASAAEFTPEFVPSDGKYPVTFGISGGAVHVASGTGEMTCSNGTRGISGVGSINAENKVTAEVTFYGCKWGSTPCFNSENLAKEKSIKSEPLIGRFGYTNEKNGKKVAPGLELEGSAENIFARQAFAKFHCGTSETTLKKQLIATVGPENTVGTEFSLVYEANSEKQLPSWIQGGRGFTPEQLTWTYTGGAPWLINVKTTLTTSKSGEIQAH